MTATILEGVEVAAAIQADVRREVEALRARGVTPGLGVLLVGDDPASAVYVRNKTRACEELGLRHETLRLPASVSTAEVAAHVEDLNRRPEIHGILVQLPLPSGLDAERLLDLVDPGKDVDGFHPDNVGRLVQKRPRFVPCTPAGILELLRRRGIPSRAAHAVVVGRSDIVGKPMGLLLLHADATVTFAHSRTRDLAAVTREADILVVAVGRPGLIRREHVREGAVVIDVGMNRLERPEEARELLGPERLADFVRRGHALVGDVHFPQVAEVAGALTPVPRGVGPLTIAMLMRNTAQAAARAAELKASAGVARAFVSE